MSFEWIESLGELIVKASSIDELHEMLAKITHDLGFDRFALSLDETRPISIVDPVAPEEFSDEVAATTPISLPDVRVPDLTRDTPRRRTA